MDRAARSGKHSHRTAPKSGSKRGGSDAPAVKTLAGSPATGAVTTKRTSGASATTVTSPKRGTGKSVAVGRSGAGAQAVSPALAHRPGGRIAKPARAIESAGREAPASASIATIDIRPAATLFRARQPKRRRAIRHLPEHPVVRSSPPEWMRAECQVSPAHAGDQAEILQLLGGLPHPPSKAEFHAIVDHPEHDASNRLVARLAGRIVGHIEVQPRTVLVGGIALRGAMVDRVAVLPECRGAGHGQRLVRAAEARLAAVRANIAFARTRVPASFEELGWTVLGRDRVTPGRPAEILARLLETAKQSVAASPREGAAPWTGGTGGAQWTGGVGAGPAEIRDAASSTRDGGVTMRQWRHVELPAILRIYGQNTGRFVGPAERGEAYSRWLVSRGGFDSLLVALVGQDRYDLHETTARIVGYCIQSGHRILELLGDPEFPGVERELLARVCAEAIENDRQEIVFESAASDPLHAAVAGDEAAPVAGERMIVARVHDPLAVLEGLVAVMGQRAVEAGATDPVELGLESPAADGHAGFRGSIVVADGKATLQVGRVGRSYLKLSADELTRLLLGQCDPPEAVARGSMVASTQVAVRFASWLFPRMPLWCPMWDDVPA